MSAIPVLRPRLPPAAALLQYLQKIDETRIYSNYGPLSEELQSRIADFFGLPHHSVTTASSGTAALMMAILATAGIPQGGRRLAFCPAFTFPAIAIAAERCGYTPFLVDVDEDTWLLEPGRLLKNPEISGAGVVLPSSPFGRPVSQKAWLDFEQQTGIPVVIDGAGCLACSHAQPTEFYGKIPVALSLHATKSFGVGEGGLVIWTAADAQEKIMRAGNFGFYTDRDSTSASVNGKMSEYHAAVGLAELDSWQDKLASLTSRVAAYRAAFEKLGIGGQFIGFPAVDPSYPLFRARSPAESQQVQNALKAEDIGFRLWYGRGIHRQTFFLGVAKDQLITTEQVAETLIGLPMAPDLSEESIGRVCTAIVGAIDL